MGVGCGGGMDDRYVLNELPRSGGCVVDARCSSLVEPVTAVGPGRVLIPSEGDAGRMEGKSGSHAVGTSLLPSEWTVFAWCASLASQSGLPSHRSF